MQSTAKSLVAFNTPLFTLELFVLRRNNPAGDDEINAWKNIWLGLVKFTFSTDLNTVGIFFYWEKRWKVTMSDTDVCLQESPRVQNRFGAWVHVDSKYCKYLDFQHAHTKKESGRRSIRNGLSISAEMYFWTLDTVFFFPFFLSFLSFQNT